MSKEGTLDDKIRKIGLNLAEIKEAFIIEELTPYFKDEKLCQKLKLRLAEIKDFKKNVKEFIRRLKDRFIDNGESFDSYTIIKEIDKSAEEKLII